jgi:hypothetical protein
MEPAQSAGSCTITPMFDGRFTKCEMSGDMPGMGPFNSFGLYGHDNVAQKFQSTELPAHRDGGRLALSLVRAAARRAGRRP